jgi:chromosomal replication initiation ATPase DnaA
VEVVSKEHGGKWKEFKDAYGDWGRDMVLYLARRRSGLTLKKFGQLAGDEDYKAVSLAVARMRARLESDRQLRSILHKCNSQL